MITLLKLRTIAIWMTIVTATPIFALYASPIQADFLPTIGQCDDPPSIQLTDELGTGPLFQPLPDELIRVLANTIPFPANACVADDGIMNDWIIEMTNLGSVTYRDLYFSADAETGSGSFLTVGNADGTIVDVPPTVPFPEDAFRIDGTVTHGINNPLIFESFLPPDELFAPTETWTFHVLNFSDRFGATTPVPQFGSIGLGAPGALGISTASILAIPIAEPTSSCVTFLLLPCLVVVARRVRSTTV